MIADTMLRLNRPADALSYYQRARQLEAADTARKTLSRKITDVRALLRIQQQNATGQPILHEPLEQDRIVRPQLTARATPVPKVATSKGGVK
jgi:hypothetical protein